MGCDGGTIPRRDELVRTKKKPEQKDKDAEREFRWRHCALTQQRLVEPIVMCALGRLYSKQSVLEHLLEKGMPESAKHIKSMKDIKQLNPTVNPAYLEAQKKEATLEQSTAPYICKLSGLEMSGKFRFMAFWTCGCTLAERALKQIKGNICTLCQTPFNMEDVIVLNGDEDDIEAMQAKKSIRAAKAKNAKKLKEKKIKQEAETVTEEQALNVQPSTSKAATEATEVDSKVDVSTNKNKLILAKRPNAIAGRDAKRTKNQ